MQLIVFIILPAVLLVNAQELEPSCENTRTSFHNVGAASDVLPSLTPQAGSVCQLSATCCSLNAETAFKERMVRGYETKVTSRLSQGLRTCRNHSVIGDVSSFITESEVQLEQDVTTVYGVFFMEYLGLFDRFFSYLANSVHTGDVTDLPTELHQMFFELYLAAFLSNPNAPSSLPNTEEFRGCFYNVFLEQNGLIIQDWLGGFERSWNLTMRYFRALKALERVVDSVLSQQYLTEQCQVSLMRMTDCARCAGFPDSAHSCNGMCLNTLRGCLLDLGDLVEPMQTFSQALVGMKDKVLTFNPFTQITILQSYIFSFLSSSSGAFYTTYSLVNSRCANLNGRQRREAHEEEPVPGGKARIARAVHSPVDAMNESAYCLLNNMALFSHLPDTLCGGEGVSAGNENCWNGRQLGSYSRSVVEFSRTLQANNPEVLVCPRVRSLFTAEIRLLRYMTRELNALLGVCSDDDEDCLVVPPTTMYYDLNGIVVEGPTSTTTDDDEESSGSGSDVDACQPVEATSAPVPATTTTSLTTTAATTIATTTAAPTTTSTETPTTVSVITAATTTAASSPPVFSIGPTGIVVEPTGSHTVPVPGGGEPTGGIPVDIQGSGSGDGSINGGRGLLPSSLTVCIGLVLTAVVLATPSSHSH